MPWPHVPNTNAQTRTEILTSGIYERLWRGEQFRVRQGETTITDILLLDLAVIPGVEIQKIDRDRESRDGMDWLLCVRFRQKWVVIAVQAKKMKTDPSGRETYPGLSQKAGSSGRLQIDVLRDFCRDEGALGAYAFYNSPRHVSLNEWNCDAPVVAGLVGCTLVPIDHVRRVRQGLYPKTFQGVHQTSAAIPLRCLFHDGNHPLVAVDDSLAAMTSFFAFDGQEVALRDELPFGFPSRAVGEPIKLDPGAFPEGQLPRWAVLIDL